MAAALRRELHGFARVNVHFVAALPRNVTGKVVRREVVAQVLAARVVD
jgi:acyl-coenzyme A synthetase/AMP-(fatty) acid ligase